MSLPVVAIVGRPNVGKSTLFNRISRSRAAITDDEPGVTRDRLYRQADWSGRDFILIDTGGFLPRSEELFDRKIREQAEVAIEEADCILLMVDAQVGPIDIDRQIARLLEKSGKKALLIANKADNPAMEYDSADFYSLGLGDPIPISCTGGRNIGDLLDQLIALLPESDEPELETDAVRIAVIGRPNVGKSSLVNKLLGDERLIVSDIPGTTRDSIDTMVTYKDQQFLLIDTAGLRRAARRKTNLEFYTTLRTIRALQRSEIVMILVEAPEGITGQDIKIFEQAIELRKGIIVIVNKWDMVEKDTYSVNQFTSTFHRKAPGLKYIPLLFISALTGQRVTRALDLALDVRKERQRRIATAELNTFIQDAVTRRHPAAKRGKFIKFFYATQSDIEPPTFVFFVNYPDMLDKSYLRYLENRLREKFGFGGNSIRMKFKKRIGDKR